MKKKTQKYVSIQGSIGLADKIKFLKVKDRADSIKDHMPQREILALLPFGTTATFRHKHTGTPKSPTNLLQLSSELVVSTSGLWPSNTPVQTKSSLQRDNLPLRSSSKGSQEGPLQVILTTAADNMKRLAGNRGKSMTLGSSLNCRPASPRPAGRKSGSTAKSKQSKQKSGRKEETSQKQQDLEERARLLYSEKKGSLERAVKKHSNPSGSRERTTRGSYLESNGFTMKPTPAISSLTTDKIRSHKPTGLRKAINGSALLDSNYATFQQGQLDALSIKLRSPVSKTSVQYKLKAGEADREARSRGSYSRESTPSQYKLQFLSSTPEKREDPKEPPGFGGPNSRTLENHEARWLGRHGQADQQNAVLWPRQKTLVPEPSSGSVLENKADQLKYQIFKKAIQSGHSQDKSLSRTQSVDKEEGKATPGSRYGRLERTSPTEHGSAAELKDKLAVILATFQGQLDSKQRQATESDCFEQVHRTNVQLRLSMRVAGLKAVSRMLKRFHDAHLLHAFRVVISN